MASSIASSSSSALQSSISTLETECLELRRRVRSALGAVVVGNGPLAGGGANPVLPDVTGRVSRLSRDVRMLEEGVGSARGWRGRLEGKAGEITRLLGNLEEPVVVEQRVVGASSPPKEMAWSPSSAQRDPAYSALIGKYGGVGAPRPAGYGDEVGPSAVRDIASKYVADSAVEETTMELKSQLIFSALNRNPGQRSSRPGPSCPEPIKELADLPGGATPGYTTKGNTAARLEEAISLALAKSSSAKTAAVTPGSGIVAAGKTATVRSGPKSAGTLTPKVPTELAAWRAVDEGSFQSLPSFVRGQITLDELNASSAAIHGMVGRRLGEGSVVFTAADVDGCVEGGRGKVVLNALTKMNLVRVKVVYGEGTVYFFV